MALPGDTDLQALGDLVTRAREGRATPEEMSQLPEEYWTTQGISSPSVTTETDC